MGTPTFYHPELDQTCHQVKLSADEAAHALRSRRLTVGQEVRLLDGKGMIAQGEISGIEQRSVEVSIAALKQVEQPAARLTIAAAVPKGDRQRFMVEMLTQLGVNEIIPVAFEHSVTRYRPKMHDKWQRWAIEACKQSQNPWLPEIDEGIALSDLIQIAPDRLVYADLSGAPASSFENKSTEPIVLIGPEGGFSEAEMALFAAAELPSIQTSDHILRTETAAVALAAQWLAP